MTGNWQVTYCRKPGLGVGRGKGVVREGLRQGRDSVGAVAHFHKSWNRPTLKCPLAPGSLVSTPLVEQQEHMGLWWVVDQVYNV